MDFVDQIKHLKASGRGKGRKLRGDHEPISPREPPNPQDLATELTGAEIAEDKGQRLFLRRASRKVSDPLDSVANLLELALGSKIQPEEVVFLDTETTGLAGGTGTVAFMIGLAWWRDGLFHIEQGFMPDYPDEPSLLAWAKQRIGEFRGLVTFNGKTFDMPLLRTRWRLQGERREMGLPHLDMLHVTRRLFSHRLRSCSLANVERQILRQGRTDDLPGRSAPKAYFHYLSEHDHRTMAAVFEHNLVDLTSTATLLARVATLLAEPESPGFEDAADLPGLGEWAAQQGDLDRAHRIFTQANIALRDTPQRTKIELRLAEICIQTGRDEEALLLWRGVTERDPLAGWPAVREIARWHERRQEWRQAHAVIDGTWRHFEQIRDLRSRRGEWRLPSAWRNWMVECERLRTELTQAAQEEQLTFL